MQQRSLSLGLQALACRCLQRILDTPPPEPVEAVASDGAGTLTVRFSRKDAPPPTDVALSPLLPLAFSPEERSVVEAVGAGALPGRRVGKSLGMLDERGQASSTLRALLRNLVNRGILANGEAGYRLTPGGLALAQIAGVLPAP